MTLYPGAEFYPNCMELQTWSTGDRPSPTFLAAVFIFMQNKPVPALAHVASHCVDTLVLTPAIVLGAFIFV